MENIIKLETDEYGSLEVPITGLSEGYLKDHERRPDLYELEPQLLGHTYGGGFTTIKESDIKPADLAIALFSARETGQMRDVKEVQLPNGDTFIIDMDHGQDELIEKMTANGEGW